MSCSSLGNQYISLYFFQNGSCCKPEKIRVRKNEIEKLISRKGRFCLYRGNCVYSICGEPISSVSNFVNNSPYVLVMPMDSFIPLQYSKVFNDLMQKMAACPMSNDQNRSCQHKINNNNRKCQSNPAIPMSCRKSSQQCVKFAPMMEEESGDELTCKKISNDKCQSSSIKKKAKLSPQHQRTRAKNQKFSVKCCITAQPSHNPSRPMIECDNEKMTQTTAEDFKCATERLKREIKEQKKRQKMYKKAARQRKEDNARPSYCLREDDEDECKDPKIIKKLEIAREIFLKKRLDMEAKISKSLDKKYDLSKYGEC